VRWDSREERNVEWLGGAVVRGEPAGDSLVAVDLYAGGVFAGELLAGLMDLARSALLDYQQSKQIGKHAGGESTMGVHGQRTSSAGLPFSFALGNVLLELLATLQILRYSRFTQFTYFLQEIVDVLRGGCVSVGEGCRHVEKVLFTSYYAGKHTARRNRSVG
jgi:hypothetical protein